jgi:CRP-like cAMP-binding protein
MYVIKMLAGRIRALDNRVLEYSTLDVHDRVCCELLRLARPDPQDPNRGLLVSLPTQAEIAARVSSRRESVARIMKALVREGALTRTGKTLVLNDVSDLMHRLQYKKN